MKSLNTHIMSEIIPAQFLEPDPLLATRFLLSQTSRTDAEPQACLSAWASSGMEQLRSVGIGHSGDRRIYPLIFQKTENNLELNLYLNSFLQEPDNGYKQL